MTRSGKDIVEFTLIYNRVKVKLYNYVLRMINDRMATEDMVQNVFLKFFENMRSIRNKSSFNFWIFKTARNEIYTYYRRKKIHVDQFGVMDSDEVDITDEFDLLIEYEKMELNELILHELDTMAYEQREVFLLKEYAGLSYKEISSVMSIEENLVKSRLFKTRKKLINRLGPKILIENI
ncbi:MAG: RNA polymerase sigma factor [Bacteroidetes bacterium]|nr:RNA polymerase sigma factor [Bacteroidota bacterium]